LNGKHEVVEVVIRRFMVPVDVFPRVEVEYFSVVDNLGTFPLNRLRHVRVIVLRSEHRPDPEPIRPVLPLRIRILGAQPKVEGCMTIERNGDRESVPYRGIEDREIETRQGGVRIVLGSRTAQTNPEGAVCPSGILANKEDPHVSRGVKVDSRRQAW